MCIVEPYKVYDWERLVNRSQIFRWNVISKFRKSSVSSTGFFLQELQFGCSRIDFRQPQCQGMRKTLQQLVNIH